MNTAAGKTETTDMLSNEEAAAAAQRNAGSAEGRGSDSEEESEPGKEPPSAEDAGTDADTLDKLRREKRLAMNRVSARERRKRKKMLIATLEQKVSELTTSNEKFKSENEQLVLRVRGRTERLASQEEEILLLRALVAKIPDSQLMQHLAARSSASMSVSPASLAKSGIAGSVPSAAFSLSDAALPMNLSLRQLLSTQGFDPTAAASATAGTGVPIGNYPGVSYGVSPNRAIEQDILGRIGRQALSHQPNTSTMLHSGIDAAMLSQNTVSHYNMSAL